MLMLRFMDVSTKHLACIRYLTRSRGALAIKAWSKYLIGRSRLVFMGLMELHAANAGTNQLRTMIRQMLL